LEKVNLIEEAVQSDIAKIPSGLDEQELVPSGGNTDDLLDIPAFLRRQAN
jgi:cell division protein FtsZ